MTAIVQKNWKVFLLFKKLCIQTTMLSKWSLWRVGRGREPWERSEAGGVIDNEVDRYGKKEAGTGEHFTHFNNKINKHKWKAAAPHGRLPHTKHKLKFQAWSSLVFHCCHSSFNPSELLRGTRDRWVVQVSFIINYSTGLTPFPRLSAPPHSSQSPFTHIWENVKKYCIFIPGQ